MRRAATSAMGDIRVLKRGSVGEIRLNRPDVLNALGPIWPRDMAAAINAVSDDPAVRVVLVTGEGRVFCSGVDLDSLAAGEIRSSWFRDSEAVIRALETLEKPVIAGVRGYCIGGGLQIAIACAVRIAADDATLGLPAAREAFIPGMATWRLARLIGMGTARNLILSGQNVDAHEGYRIGLVNAVVPKNDLDMELERWVSKYLEVPASTLRWAKRLTNQAFDLPFESFVAEYDNAMEAVLASPEHQEAMRAWRARKS